MSEKMIEKKEANIAQKLWSSALRTVKGDSTQALVENFTAEVTMVVEGICEDQAKLRGRMDALENQEDRDHQQLQSEAESIERMLRENQEKTDQRLRVIEDRLNAMERTLNKTEKAKKKLLGGNWLTKLILLAAIVCGAWVIVTIVGKL